ncbi:ABC transporter ATP-binding protein, partial [Streptomyces parvus]|uniref:ABC transporter ATP-binding protein n=1 Tax=Streptomyces parvus TaxID=66428 RepID=UPI0030B8B8C8
MTTTTDDASLPAAEDDGLRKKGPATPGPEPSGDPFDQDDLPAPPGATLALLFSLLAPMRGRVAVAALLLVVQQVAMQAGPLLVAYAIDSGVPAFRDHDYGPLIAVAVGYALCSVGAGVLQYGFIRAAARINQDVLLELRGRIFRHAQALSVDFHERYTSGRLISRSTTDVESLRELLSEGLQELIGVVLSFVSIALVLLWLDLGIGAIATLSFVPLYLMVRMYRRRASVAFTARSTAIAAVIVKFAETMNGIRPVQAFRRERSNDAAFTELNTRHERSNGDAILEMARYVVGSRLIANTAVAGMVLWGAYRVAEGTLALGVLAAAVLYLRRLYDPIDRLGMFLNSYESAAASLTKIAGLLAQTPNVPETEHPRELPPRSGDLPGREVVFDGVRFAYRTGGEVLPTFDLRIPAGRTVAVVGSTGAGKSTLAKLLARFYDPTDGRVLLDGTDLRDLSTAELRRGVVMVTQEAFLFSGTVAENIAIGRPDATREEIEHAAKAIGAHDFIAALPDGYDTDVRKRGGRISAGQRQLVAFARALLANPSVLILDEATSSLDIPGERAVQRAMDTVLHGRTAVVIAHRLSTVEIADRVLVLVTAFLAAAFPRAVDAYETKGLRHDIRGADAGRSTVEVARPQPGLELPQEQREAEARSPELTRVGKALLKALPAPLRADTSSLAHGVRTTKPVVANEPWLPRPEAKPPRLTYAAQSGLKNHATLSSGTWPATPGGVTADSRAVQGAVTEETAARLKVKVGATIALPTAAQEPITVTITGIVAPRDPQGSYWSTDPLLRSPSLVPDPTDPFPVHFWTGTVLLAEDAGPVLLSTAAEPVLFWRIPPDPAGLTGPDGARLTSAIASLESGPGLLKVRAIAGDTAAVFTGLGHIVRDNARMRDAISPVIAVAALGIGSVAAVVLVMTGALIAARRKAELALMRSRGGSLRGIGGRLLAETSVTVLPASALGLLLAVLAVGEGRWWPAALAAAGVGLLVCVALPLRTTLQHIRPTLHGAREDMVSAKPSRRRTVAELTLLVLAVGAVTALRRRGTSESDTDLLVSGAPVLVALIAALVLVRLYPLPLRLAARPMARLRGAIGFLSLARAGRSSAGGALPLLALLLALATAA